MDSKWNHDTLRKYVERGMKLLRLYMGAGTQKAGEVTLNRPMCYGTFAKKITKESAYHTRQADAGAVYPRLTK